MTARTGDPGQVHRRDRRLGVDVRLDGVDSMALRAHRSLPIPTSDGLAVAALRTLFLHCTVARCTGFRHVELEDGGFRILGGQALLYTVTVGTDGRPLGSGS